MASTIHHYIDMLDALALIGKHMRFMFASLWDFPGSSNTFDG